MARGLGQCQKSIAAREPERGALLRENACQLHGTKLRAPATVLMELLWRRSRAMDEWTASSLLEFARR